MTNDIRPPEIQPWFRWFVAVVVGLSLLVILYVALRVPPPANDALLKAPQLGSLALEAVQFEVGYFTFLASLTGGVTAAMLAFLQLDPKPGIWRTTTLVSVFAFMFALALVTIGYAMRNGWMVTQAALPSFLVSVDKYANGPITAAMYIIGLAAMLVSVWDRYSR